MHIEYEARVLEINKEKLEQKLKELGAESSGIDKMIKSVYEFRKLKTKNYKSIKFFPVGQCVIVWAFFVSLGRQKKALPLGGEFMK